MIKVLDMQPAAELRPEPHLAFEGGADDCSGGSMGVWVGGLSASDLFQIIGYSLPLDSKQKNALFFSN